jgi:hypothetical protein
MLRIGGRHVRVVCALGMGQVSVADHVVRILEELARPGWEANEQRERGKAM